MPKLPRKKSKPSRGEEPISTRELAERIEQVRGRLLEAVRELGRITEVLYTTGLADKGPTGEDSDDIPF